VGLEDMWERERETEEERVGGVGEEGETVGVGEGTTILVFFDLDGPLDGPFDDLFDDLIDDLLDVPNPLDANNTQL